MSAPPPQPARLVRGPDRARVRVPDRDRRGWILLSERALRAMRVAIAEAAGPDAADEALFRLGLRWGEDEADALGLDADPRAGLEAGAKRFAELGLGVVTIDEARIDANDCLVSGHVRGAPEPGPGPDGSEPDGSLCVLFEGYLTGLARRATRMDVVCSPFRCSKLCQACGCAFEIRPAHRQRPHEVEAPAGSARFFLDAVGTAFGDRDIALSDLIENTTDAVVLIDVDDVVRYWNRGAEEMFQFGREEVVGRRIGRIVPRDLLEEGELEWIQEHLDTTGSLTNFLTRRVRKDGTELLVTLTRTLLHDSRGVRIGSTAILRDVTELTKAQEELYQVRGLAMIGQLAAQVAHEIKNPLAGIYGAVQILARGLDEGDPRREVFDEVGQEIQRLDETVQDLLRFARPSPPRRTTIELSSFLSDLAESIAFRENGSDHRVRVEPEGELLVQADPKLLGQAVRNLLHNAVQAMGERPGEIVVRVCRSGRSAAIDVEDSGPGIPHDVLPRIFDPFFTTKSRGTGLGLAIAKKNVESHGGTLEAENLHAGGALFRLTLPLCPEV